MGIRDEINEIYQDMKDDFKKGKEYAHQYRKTIFWIFIAFITMQFTDILSLGASWQNMCQQNSNLRLKKSQKGGLETPANKALDAALEVAEAEAKKEASEAEAKKKEAAEAEVAKKKNSRC